MDKNVKIGIFVKDALIILYIDTISTNMLVNNTNITIGVMVTLV